ncbi:MAG TPA: GntR family transcriptional regulator [Dongiaceae bacterium]|jgi:DNA-binding GntR family transcriptional regulator|nr:GntR family transcriptional regulator [Dongiaceae bacterium]
MTSRKKKSPSDLLRSAAAYEQIKIDIVACLLKPGEQITEGELQEQYSIRKATLRAALARLSQEGLVRSEPRRGYRITPITLRDINEIFDTRLIVEPAAMKLGARAMADHSLVSLEAAMRQTQKPETLRSATAFLAASKELRLTIARTTGNFRLVRALAQLLDESERVLHLGYLHLDLTKILAEQHKALVGAVRKGNGEAAESLSLRHIADTKHILVEALVSSASFLAINLHGLSDADLPAPGQPGPRPRRP